MKLSEQPRKNNLKIDGHITHVIMEGFRKHQYDLSKDGIIDPTRDDELVTLIRDKGVIDVLSDVFTSSSKNELTELHSKAAAEFIMFEVDLPQVCRGVILDTTAFTAPEAVREVLETKDILTRMKVNFADVPEHIVESTYKTQLRILLKDIE